MPGKEAGQQLSSWVCTVLISSAFLTVDGVNFQFHFKLLPEGLRRKKKKSIYVTVAEKTGIDNVQLGEKNN